MPNPLYFYLVLGIFIGFLAIGTYYWIRKNRKLKEEYLNLQLSVNSTKRGLTQLTKVYDEESEKLKNNQTLNEQLMMKNNQLETDRKTMEMIISTLDQLNETKTAQMHSNEINRLREIDEKCKQYQEQSEKVYADIANEFLIDWRNMMEKMSKEQEDLQNKIEQYQVTYDSIITREKEKYEKDCWEDFHSLQITEEATSDIKTIRKLCSELKLASALDAVNKVIYKCYYENAYLQMVGRLFSGKTVCGIYKITNKQNKMSYVGQSVDIAERFRQHIKKGVGADTPTQNKLYPVMYRIGPESFTFEVLEECPKEKLSDREDYWQEFYRVKDYGYSIK